MLMNRFSRRTAFIAAGVLLAGLATLAASVLQRSRPSVAAEFTFTTDNSLTAGATATDRWIQKAEAVIKRAPRNAEGYNQLCAAFIQKGRETGDFSFNTRAEAALRRSLEIAPATTQTNYDALQLQGMLHLDWHRFGEAADTARRALQLRANDHIAYGILSDALLELGDYKGAVEAADRMADLHPDTASYSRISWLRSLHGDLHGAIEVMRMAVAAASPLNPESQAWCRVQLGNELMNAGRRAEAEREYDRALQVFPDYHKALAAKARAQVAAGNPDQAVVLYQRARERAPELDTIIALGNLYAHLGREKEAGEQYEFAEFAGRASGGTAALQLALLWADHETRLDEALAAARRERAVRSDIFTCDVLAWCLYKKGDPVAAKMAIQEALRLGTRDARIHYHAGLIFHALGDSEQAIRHLKLALDTDAFFDLRQAEVAKQTLRTLGDNWKR